MRFVCFKSVYLFCLSFDESRLRSTFTLNIHTFPYMFSLTRLCLMIRDLINYNSFHWFIFISFFRLHFAQHRDKNWMNSKWLHFNDNECISHLNIHFDLIFFFLRSQLFYSVFFCVSYVLFLHPLPFHGIWFWLAADKWILCTRICVQYFCKIINPSNFHYSILFLSNSPIDSHINWNEPIVQTISLKIIRLFLLANAFIIVDLWARVPRKKNCAPK